jgi:[acyl-carrier-protein] S-malonyltransferase
MKPAAEQLAQMLTGIPLSVPSVGVVNNVDVRVEIDASAIKNALVQQLYSPVRWVETVQWLKSQGVTRIVEVGPGKVLAGLIKRIDGDIENFAVADLKTLRDYCVQ